MDNVSVLCDMDNDLLHDYSRRCIARITGRSLFSVPFPFLAAYMEANVKKEAAKDRLIIEHAAEAVANGKDPGDIDVDDIFERTKTVDKAFLNRLLIPSFSIHVHYEDIADIRKKRITRLSKAAGEVLRSWGDSRSLSEVVLRTYSEKQFREIILDVLHLYNLETLKISSSIRFFSPFNKAMHHFAETVYDAMEAVSENMVEDYAIKLFQGECACTERI